MMSLTSNRGSPAERAERAERVDISVVIPCRNASATLGAQLDALLAQKTAARFEVVVADNGSTDSSSAVASAKGEPIRVIDAGRSPGINVARNEGVLAAHGPYILMCDADDVVEPGWIESHWAAFQGGAHCVSGTLIMTTTSGLALATVNGPHRLSLIDPVHAVGSNCGFSRVAYDAVDGFDETFAGGSDETDFFWRAGRAGFGVVDVPGAIVRYTLRSGFRSALRQGASYGEGHVRLVKKHVAVTGVQLPTRYQLVRAIAGSAGRALTRRGYPQLQAIKRLGFTIGVMHALWR